MHTTAAFHCQCLPAGCTQADFLQHMFVLGVNVARNRSWSGAGEADLQVAAAAMGLLVAVLEWDFRHSELPAAAAAALARNALQETAQVRNDRIVSPPSSCCADIGGASHRVFQRTRDNWQLILRLPRRSRPNCV